MDMKKMMKQAQQMQARIQKAQAEVAEMTAEGTAGGGMVKATVKGDMTVESVSIDKIVVNPDDTDMLEDLVVAAVNDAFRAMNEIAQAHLDEATGGMSIPGM